MCLVRRTTCCDLHPSLALAFGSSRRMDPFVINLFLSLYKCVATPSLQKPSDDMVRDQTKLAKVIIRTCYEWVHAG